MEASPRALHPELSSEVLGWKVPLFQDGPLIWPGMGVKFCGHLEIGALSLSFSDDSSSGTCSQLCVLDTAPALFQVSAATTLMPPRLQIPLRALIFPWAFSFPFQATPPFRWL